MVGSDSLEELPQVRMVALPRPKRVVAFHAGWTHLDARAAQQRQEANGAQLRPGVHVQLIWIAHEWSDPDVHKGVPYVCRRLSVEGGGRAEEGVSVYGM